LNKDIHWLREDFRLKNGEEASYKARIRYRQPLENVKLYQKEDALYFIFDKDQNAIAEGQFVAWYKDDELIGSGVIN
jgi:tRNA-specific 2-thiouridylase